MIRMPGSSYSGEPTEPAPDLVTELRRDVEHIAGTIGERNFYTPREYRAAAAWIEGELRRAGYKPSRQTFESHGEACSNIEVERPGNGEIVIVGAHYDSIQGCPAANDNGTGVAATLALARRFAKRETKRTLRFVLFANEEPPSFQTDDMGSLHYARRCKQRNENVVAMLSLETLGYFTDEPDSQHFPAKPMRLAYGDKGNFVAFVGNVGSAGLVRRALKTFRDHAKVPSHGLATFAAVPGVGWSDHWAFWQVGYNAIMVTDTAPYRYAHYHERTDTPDKLKYEPFARVVEALVPVIAELVND